MMQDTDTIEFIMTILVFLGFLAFACWPQRHRH